MLKISLSQKNKLLLFKLQMATGEKPEVVAQKALEGTLAYYAAHGTLTYLTADTKDCYGCRLLANIGHQEHTLSKPGRKAKIIPFDPTEPQANGTD